MNSALRAALAGMVIMVFCISCASSSKDHLLATEESQLQLRSIQTRAFDTSDKETTLRTVIATLQDLGFVVEEANLMLGNVSGTKLNKYALRMTVTVRPKGETQMLVRASAQYELTAVDDPEPYQQFFAALEKAMFLTAQQVD